MEYIVSMEQRERETEEEGERERLWKERRRQ